MFVLRSQDNRFEVQVGQPLEARTEILEELAENLTWPALGLWRCSARSSGWRSAG